MFKFMLIKIHYKIYTVQITPMIVWTYKQYYQDKIELPTCRRIYNTPNKPLKTDKDIKIILYKLYLYVTSRRIRTFYKILTRASFKQASLNLMLKTLHSSHGP